MPRAAPTSVMNKRPPDASTAIEMLREHSLAKIPLIFVCGRKEAEEKSVNVRTLGSQHPKSMSLDEALSMVKAEIVPPDVKRALAEA